MLLCVFFLLAFWIRRGWLSHRPLVPAYAHIYIHIQGHEDGVVSPDVRAAQGNKRPPQVPRAHPLPTPPVDHPPVAIEKDKENIAQLDNNLQPDPHIMQVH